MTRKPATADQPIPDLAVLRIEGQPYHPDPEVMAAHASATPEEAFLIGINAALNDQIETDIANRHDAFGLNTGDGTRNDPTPASATEAMIYAKELDAIQRRAKTPAQDAASNPYLIESSTVLGDLAHEAHRARLALNALDNEIEHLNEDADYQIARITARRDIEIEQREKRKTDLMKIVAADSIVNGEQKGNDQ